MLSFRQAAHEYWKDIEISAQSTDRFLIKDGDKQLIDRNTVKQNFGKVKLLLILSNSESNNILQINTDLFYGIMDPAR